MSEMKNERMQTGRGIGLACLVALAASAAAGQESARGLYIDNKSSGVTWNILIDRGTERLLASATHPFKSGDKLTLQLELNRAGYVYILNRTLNGDPDALKSKGIEMIQSEDREKPPSADRAPYRLLYPSPKDTGSNFLAAHQTHSIRLRMDQNPGVEKMLIVVSAKPVDLSHEFNLKTGDMVTVKPAPKPAPKPGPGGGGAGARIDTNDDALARLNQKLIDFGDNAEVAHSDSQRGIILPAPGKPGSDPGAAPKAGSATEDPNGYGGSKDPNKPFLVDVTLKHYPR
jgi:hypothetical protein